MLVPSIDAAASAGKEAPGAAVVEDSASGGTPSAGMEDPSLAFGDVVSGRVLLVVRMSCGNFAITVMAALSSTT